MICNISKISGTVAIVRVSLVTGCAMNNFQKLMLVVVSYVGLFIGITANAQDYDDERTLLTVISDGAEPFEFTEADIMAIDQTVVRTENEFVDGMVAFEGPLARDVLEAVDPNFAETVEIVKLIAVNEYAVEIPVTDFLEYDVLFALSADGQKFSLRDKGPIWVIYPMSDNPVLVDRIYNDRLIWQLTTVEMR